MPSFLRGLVYRPLEYPDLDPRHPLNSRGAAHCAIHGFDPSTPIEETMRALDDVVRSGKACYVGLSDLPAWLAMKANTLAEFRNLSRFQRAQVYYSIAGR